MHVSKDSENLKNFANFFWEKQDLGVSSNQINRAPPMLDNGACSTVLSVLSRVWGCTVSAVQAHLT
jgi:hypothetical protein